ncbi:MAG TPA: DUF4136 domain-containing protein, partial [Luteimonas sp.]|nr:DUF4136 domain-containing protein [Luteimonas sp.]
MRIAKPAKRIRQTATTLLALVLLAGCATGPMISSEADPRADFTRYRTFAFYSPLAAEKDGYATPTTDRLKAAVRAQLESRGYVHAAQDPDLWVNLNAYMERRTDVSSSPFVDYGYYYSYRARGYLAVPYWNQHTSVHRYTEGTVNVDIVDVARNTLVWEGIAVGRMANLRVADRDARIDST